MRRAMARYVLFLAFCCVATTLHILAQTPSPTPPGNRHDVTGEDEIVRINTTLVTVPVRVLNRDGNYISNLRREDFRVFEDGVEQQIVYFEPVEEPITVILLLDTSDSTRFRIEEIQDAAVAFVDQLRPNDRVAVISFNENINVLSEATTDREALRQAIRSARTSGGTRIYDAVDQVINQRVKRLRGRKVVVLFSDGVDTVSGSATYESTLHDIEEADTLIYPVHYSTYIDLERDNDSLDSLSMDRKRPMMRQSRVTVTPGLGSSLRDHKRGSRYLQEMARRTGSHLFTANNLRSLTRAFAEIAEELRWQYSLGYYPPTTSAQSKQRRQIRVRVNRPRAIVRARNSYILEAPTSGDRQD